MKRNGLFAVIALALGTAGVMSVAHAQDTGMATESTGSFTNPDYSNWYIVPRIGVVVPDSDRRVQTDPVGGLGVGFWITPNFTLDVEATGDNADFKDDSPRPGKQWETVGLDVAGRWYFMDPTSQWRPFVMAGVGFWRHAAVSEVLAQAGGECGCLGPHSNSGWGPGATVGVGVLYNVSDRIAVRGEIAARYYRDVNSAQLAGLAGPGLPHTYGPKQWLDTMATVGLVFNMGHPAPPPPPPAAPPPPPAAPPPPPPPQNVVIDLRGVNFKFDRPKKGETDIGPTLKPPQADSVAILDQAVDTLNRYPQVQIEIDGYTDSIGTDQYNQGLSERRANIVNQYLTSHGIDSSRITAVKGFGENDPIDTNKTAAGRQRNRRVEFKVEGQGMNQDQQQQQQQ
ncbi:MAG TPA: OmpA family protein [Rhodanobacteraceae bacterium]|nr:OmpA family protein [Rhodanobacteraceae bacterium]